MLMSKNVSLFGCLSLMYDRASNSQASLEGDMFLMMLNKKTEFLLKKIVSRLSIFACLRRLFRFNLWSKSLSKTLMNLKNTDLSFDIKLYERLTDHAGEP